MIHFRGMHCGFLIAFFAWILAAPADGAVSGIIWADPGFYRSLEQPEDIEAHTHRISRYDLSTATAGPVRLTGPDTHPDGLVLDSQAGKLYWLDDAEDLYRSNRDGSGMERLLTGAFHATDPDGPMVSYRTGMAFDPVARTIYWGDYFNLYRWNPDVPGVIENVHQSSHLIRDLAIDSMGRYGYLLSRSLDLALPQPTGLIERMDLATGQTSLIHNFQLDASINEDPGSFAFDELNGMMYWGTWPGRLYRSALDGTQSEFLLDIPFGGINSIAVDGASGSLYFTNGSTLYRSNLDGGDLQVLLDSTGDPDGILFAASTLVLDPNPIPLPNAAWAGLGLLSVMATRRGGLERKNRFV